MVAMVDPVEVEFYLLMFNEMYPYIIIKLQKHFRLQGLFHVYLRPLPAITVTSEVVITSFAVTLPALIIGQIA